MGCSYNNEFRQANDVNELTDSWKSHDQYFFKILTSTNKFSYLRADIAELHSNIYEVLIKAQYQTISIEFKHLKNILSSYADSLHSKDKETIDKSLKDLEEVVIKAEN